jgi:hypothetical protein
LKEYYSSEREREREKEVYRFANQKERIRMEFPLSVIGGVRLVLE